MQKQMKFIPTTAILLILIIIVFGIAHMSSAATAVSVIFIDDNGNPLSEANLRVLCYKTNVPDSPPIADLAITTTTGGAPMPNLPTSCTYLAAMQLQHTQSASSPEHGPAYWIYTTSWAPGTTTPQPAAGTIKIREDWTLVLFNVVVSLGWEPELGSSYETDLRAGLRQASDYLYDLTEGQMALGPVTVYENGHFWDNADLRILPANDYRPAAYMGGMVAADLPYSSSTGAATIFTPANIFLGRYWDGNDAASGSWASHNGYATLIHEWAHYALFLYDEYQQMTGTAQYCTCHDLPNVGSTIACHGLEEPGYAASVMAYQYTASEFWEDGFHLPFMDPGACTGTPQWAMHGMSDWKTLQTWHTIQGISLPSPTLIPVKIPSALSSGPDNSGLSGDLYGRSPGYALYLPPIIRSGAPPTSSYTSNLEVYLNDSTSVTATLPTQVYLLKDVVGDSVARILPQGQVLGTAVPGTGLLGSISLWGVTADDRVRVFVDRYATERNTYGRFTYPLPGAVDVTPDAGGTAVLAEQDSWALNLDWEQGWTDGRLTTLTVKLKSLSHTLGGLTIAQLCSLDADTGCASQWKQQMTLVAVDTWSASFTPLPGTDTLPAYGILRIIDPNTGEVIRWYQQLGGVGPGHIDADAPLRDWHVMVDTTAAAPDPGDCNHVLVTPATNTNALAVSLGQDVQNAPIGGVLGTPLDINVLLPTNGICAQVGGQDHILPVPVTLTLFYSEAELNQHAINEMDLRLLHFNRGQNVWEVAAYPTSQDTNLDWISFTPVTEDGIYAIGYISFP